MSIHRMDSSQPPEPEHPASGEVVGTPVSAQSPSSLSASDAASNSDQLPAGTESEPNAGGDLRAATGEIALQGRLVKGLLNDRTPERIRQVQLTPDQLPAPPHERPPVSAANESVGISSMRTVVSAQAMFYQRDIDQSGEPDYATEIQPLGSDNNLVDEVLGEGPRSTQPMEAAPLSSPVRRTGSGSSDDDGLSKGTKEPGSS